MREGQARGPAPAPRCTLVSRLRGRWQGAAIGGRKNEAIRHGPRLAAVAGGPEEARGPEGLRLPQAGQGLDQLAAAEQGLDLDGREDALGRDDDRLLGLDEHGRVGVVDRDVNLRAGFEALGEDFAAGDAVAVGQQAAEKARTMASRRPPLSVGWWPRGW